MKSALQNFPKLFLSNLKTIIFAFVLALIIWFAISFQLFPEVTTTLTMPIAAEPSILMRDLNLELAVAFNETVDVSVLGRRYAIRSLVAGDFYANLDFTGISEAGVHEIPVIIRTHLTDAEFEITTHDITKEITIIQTTEKTIQVITDVENVAVAEGMRIHLDEVRVTPPSVVIRGESSLVDSIRFARVSAVSDTALAEQTELPGTLVFLDSNGHPMSKNGVYVEDRAFTVTVPVFMHRTLPLEIDITNAPENFYLNSLRSRMTFEPSELIIASPDDSISKHTVWSLGHIPLRNITFGDLEQGIVITVDLPDGYMNISGHDTVTLEFSNVGDYGAVTLNVPPANFHVVNPPSGYNAVPRPLQRPIPVSVVGPSEVIQMLTAADISGTINLAGIADISTGIRSVGATISIMGEDVLAWVVGTYEIEVTITVDNQ
jgi:YbbR domain-containing protein